MVYTTFLLSCVGVNIYYLEKHFKNFKFYLVFVVNHQTIKICFQTDEEIKIFKRTINKTNDINVIKKF